MSIRPNKYGDYHLSDVFAGGTDLSEDNGNIIYIACVNLERGIAIKAYLNSYKLNVSKVVEFQEDEGMVAKIPKEYGTDLNYEIGLDMPAYDVAEAKNNLAKIEELQKLLGKIGSRVSNAFSGIKVPFFSVWFKNLISSGKDYSTYPNPSQVTIEQITNCGFICIIDKVKYEPDMEAGFFESDGLLLPKNIKLNLQLKYGAMVEQSQQMTQRKFFPNLNPLFAFDSLGHYNTSDRGLFPYGIKIHDYPPYKENIGSKFDFTNQTLNELDSTSEGGYDPTRIFISIEVNKTSIRSLPNRNSSSRRRRWVAFKPFIESFSRDLDMRYSTNKDKSRTIGVETVNMSDTSTLKDLTYEVSFNVPSYNLEEAKKNCGKIQYLIRMMAKPSDAEERATSEEGQELKDKFSKRTVRVYIPNFIENRSTTQNVTHFSDMYNNSVSLVFTNLSFDIDPADGFFEERVKVDNNLQSKKIYPKTMKISLVFKHENPDSLIKSYNLKTSKNGDIYYTQRAEVNIAGEAFSKFPFRKQTIKLGR